MKEDLSKRYHVMKYVRVIAKDIAKGSKHLETLTYIWPSIQQEIAEWLDIIIANPWRHVTALNEANANFVTMWTDSSNSGYGIIIFKNNTFHIIAGKWSPSEQQLHINLKEMRTVMRATRDAKELLSGTRIRLFIDNNPAKSSLEKGYSPSFELNAEVSRVKDDLQAIHASVDHVEYVPSKLNPSDYPSRDKEPPRELLDLWRSIITTTASDPKGLGMGETSTKDITT